MLNSLIVGGGSIGKRHLKNLQTLGYSNIWVLKRTEDKSFESEHNVKVITSFKQANLIDFDCIFVCSPTALHNESLAFAKRKGLDVFMEKPLIHSTEGLSEACAIQQNSEEVFFIGFMLRYHPLVRKVKEIVDAQTLGAVYNARFSFGSFLPYWHPWEDYKISYASRKELGGGVINTITHELDLIQYFFGEPQKLYCEVSNFDMLGIEVEEHCEAIFSYQDKVVTLHLDYLQKDYDRNIKILCENGKIVWNWHDNYVLVQKHNEESYRIILDTTFDVNQLYIDEVKDFIKLVEGKQNDHSLDFNHAVRNTALTLLMHQSAKEGKKLNYQHATS